MNAEKEKLIKQIEEERLLFADILAGLSWEQKTGEKVMDDWTVKDIMAHVTAWEIALLEWIDTASAGRSPDMPVPGQWAPYIDSFNHTHFLENEDKPLAEIQREFDQVYERVIEAFLSLPDKDDDPFWSVWYGREPPWIFFNTYSEHYREHRQQLSTHFQ